MGDDSLLIERRGAVRVLTLHRPDRINALTSGLHAELHAALDDVAADPGCRAVLLTGAGAGFCSGQDLTEIEPGIDLGRSLEQRYNPLVRRMRGMRQPIVCAVHGVAAGAGANLALACDIVIAAHSARFVQAFVKIGLVPDAGGTYFLPRLVGDARARGLALLGEAVTGTQAEAWGLIWRAVDEDRVLPEAHALAAHLATQPTEAIGLIKQALAASGTHTLDQQLDLERDLQRRAGWNADFREGVQVFLDKRPAVFTGEKAGEKARENE